VIRCACLLVERDQQILLVRVRNNHLWYLPGGTIEPGETAPEALVREIGEELGVVINVQTIALKHCVVGPAYGRKGLVELNCFAAAWTGTMTPQAEVAELGWFGANDRDMVAPAVRVLFDKRQHDMTTEQV
jgi:8-oxo-dGTP diphosphatase